MKEKAAETQRVRATQPAITSFEEETGAHKPMHLQNGKVLSMCRVQPSTHQKRHGKRKVLSVVPGGKQTTRFEAAPVTQL